MEYELDSGISSGYESTDSEGEKRELSKIAEEIEQECENNHREVNKNLESDETTLVNNEKLREALREEMAKYRKFRMKYNAGQTELGTAEMTVKELTSIECHLRKSLKYKEEEIRIGKLKMDHLEEENATLRERICRFKKIRWKEQKMKSQERTNSVKEEMDEKYIKLEKELEDQKIKYRDRENEL